MNYLARDIRTLDVKADNIFNKISPEQKSLKMNSFIITFSVCLFFNAIKVIYPPSCYVESDMRSYHQELLELTATEPSFKAILDQYQRNKG